MPEDKKYQLCQEVIWLSTDKANTYCMREAGHTGKHNIVNEEPKEETCLTQEPISNQSKKDS
jgi:hypothetical protein